MKFCIPIFTIIFTQAIHAQVQAPLAIDSYLEGTPKLTPCMNIRLFDLSEIAKRKIDSAYIIRHPASWEPGFPNACSYGDTLELYCFDASGRIMHRSYFQGIHGEYSTTLNFDTLGNVISRSTGKHSVIKIYSMGPPDTSEWKNIITRKKIGFDSVITETIFWKFNSGIDTAFVTTRIINDKGKLTEIVSRINKRYKAEIDDEPDESTYHFKYKYDDEGRLIYFISYDYKDQPSLYKSIIYSPYSQVTETYDGLTNKLLDTEIQLMAVNNGILTISTQYEQITLTPLERDSKLYKLKTISNSKEFPYIEYYEISYR